MHPEVSRPGPGACPSCGMALEPAEISATRYVCPMHPEVIADQPGACPKCGMALEPQAVSLEQEENPELRDMSRRFRWSLALTLPLFLLSMSEMLPGWSPEKWLQAPYLAWVQLALATPVVLWGGAPFFRRGWDSVLHRSLNMFTLIALGSGAAYLHSVVAALRPELFPESFRRADGTVDLYFEAAAVIVTLVLLGQVMELRARGKTGQALRALLALAPPTARRLGEDGEAEIPLQHVRVGDRLRVRPGDRVPVDGTVIEGAGAVDESMVSGEPIPVEKGPGDLLIGATINGAGSLLMRADRVGSDTMLAQIVRMVSEAQRSRAPIQRLADRVSAWFVPVVVLAAGLTFLVWAMLGPAPRLAHALVAAVAVLIVACPCALGLATPMSVMVATGRGAQAGVLLRDAEALELLARVDTLVVDKTGTLTEGRPRLESIIPLEPFDEAEILSAAAALERGSEHPLASAIVGAAEERGNPVPDAEGFRYTPGGGVAGRVGGRAVVLGNERYLQECGIDTAALEAQAEEHRSRGHTIVLVALDDRLAGALVIADAIKESTPAAIRALIDEGLRIVMATGDGRATAETVARQLQIEEVRAAVTPVGTGAVIAALRAAGHLVAMAGDGINDAPALARAHVGIAMGTGTDVAMESAGVVLVRGDLRGIVRARRLSRAALRNIRQNLAFAFLYNILSIPLAAGLLYPVTGLLLSPMIASAAMSLSSVSVIGNALRLRSVDLAGGPASEIP